MKCYLDTNVLIYFTFESSSGFEQARDLLLMLRTDEFSICISPLTIDEFSHQLDYLIRDNKTQRKDYFEILGIIFKSIFSLPNIQIVNPPIEKSKQYKFIDLMQEYDLKPRDAYHLLTMIENKIDYIATYDKDFDKVIKSGIIKKYN